jgi:hypothetical protein
MSVHWWRPAVPRRFGFNNGKTMVDGLDAEPTPSWEGGDFATIVQQLKLLGFNAVRLPFQFSDLYVKKPQVRVTGQPAVGVANA